MTLDFGTFLRQVAGSLGDPRGTARQIMAIDLPRTARWELMALVVIAGVFVSHFGALMTLREGMEFNDPVSLILREIILERPVIHAILQMSILVITVFMVHWVGRTMGGTGRLEDGILLVTWLEAFLILVRVAQLALYFLLPGLADLVGVVALVASVWLFTNFIAELHGFQSLLRVFAMIVMTALGVIFGLSFFLALIGATMGGTI